MSKIGDDLRDYCKKVLCYTHYYDKFWHFADRIDAEMVELPRDRDGVPIHAGDTLDGYGKTIEVVEMRYGRSGWVLISRDGNGYVDTFAFTHRHAPTVEDVLRALTDEVWNRCCEGATESDSGIDGLVAECAAKLRLADENA